MLSIHYEITCKFWSIIIIIKYTCVKMYKNNNNNNKKKEVFHRQKKYGVSVRMSRHPGLSQYIHEVGNTHTRTYTSTN